MVDLTRRQSLGILAGVATASTATIFTAATQAAPTAQERFDHHLAELKKAAEELDPQIGYWHAKACPDGDFTCSVIITAFRVTGRYDGDGIYEAAKEGWDGKRIKYHVRLRGDLLDGERSFDVSTAMDRVHLTESRLRTYVARRIGNLPEGV